MFWSPSQLAYYQVRTQRFYFFGTRDWSVVADPALSLVQSVNQALSPFSGLRYSTDLQATGEGKPNLYSYPLHGVTANLAWLAPEILQQNLLGYNESSDIYSLAVTICEMANGMVPFSDMEPTLMMVEKLHGATPTLLNPALSSHFHQLVAVCCSLDQQHRYHLECETHRPQGRDVPSLCPALCHPMRQLNSLSKLSTDKLRARPYLAVHEIT